MKNYFYKFKDKLKRTCEYCGEDKVIGVITFKETTRNQRQYEEVRVCANCYKLHINYKRSRKYPFKDRVKDKQEVLPLITLVKNAQFESYGTNQVTK